MRQNRKSATEDKLRKNKGAERKMEIKAKEHNLRIR